MKEPVMRTIMFYMLPDRKGVSDFCHEWQYVIAVFPVTAIDEFGEVTDYSTYRLFGCNEEKEFYEFSCDSQEISRVVQVEHDSTPEIDLVSFHNDLYPEGYTGQITELREVIVAEARGE